MSTEPVILPGIKGWNSPLERHVQAIRKNFKEDQKEVLKIWVDGVIKGLLGNRMYVDLNSARMEMQNTGTQVFPVISLRPVIGHETEEDLRHYVEFFNLYTVWESDLFLLIFKSIQTRAGLPKQRWIDYHITERVNLLKLIITLMNTDNFDLKIILNGVEFNEDGSVTTTGDFNRYIESCGVAHVIGEKFMEIGDLSSEVDDKLIGAFYRYGTKLTKFLTAQYNEVAAINEQKLAGDPSPTRIPDPVLSED